MAPATTRQAAGKRFFVLRLRQGTGLSTRSGHQIDLRGILPQQEGEAREMGVLLGQQTKRKVAPAHGPGLAGGRRPAAQAHP
jgi:hypothetical protein